MRALLMLVALALSLSLSSSPSAACESPCDGIPPSQIALAAYTPVCGQVTLTASGYGLALSDAFQLVAGNDVRLVSVPNSRVLVATFSAAAGWAQAQVRTKYGGYLRTSPAVVWYFVRAC